MQGKHPTENTENGETGTRGHMLDQDIRWSKDCTGDHDCTAAAHIHGCYADDPCTHENFEGHQPRDCGDHRTVGTHRAWCFDCHEWCYPGEGACNGCERPRLRAVVDAARAVVTEWRVRGDGRCQTSDMDALTAAIGALGSAS